MHTTGRLLSSGLNVTLDFLGEDADSAEQTAATVAAYCSVINALGRATAGGRAEVSVKLSALGQALPRDGDKIALENARQICEAAAAADTTVTLDMEDHTTTDRTLGTLQDLRADFPWVGVALQAYLTRTAGDCRDLSGPGSRVRLCKGAYAEPTSVAYQGNAVNDSYRSCLEILLSGEGYPMIATHDPKMISAARELIVRQNRTPDSYEFQMLLGIRPEEQRALVGSGNRVRIYVPYGGQWYAYFMRRLAERPANLTFFLRALASGR
ncbi:proline dehydrogenase family protein [Actinopolymorpha pittospori]